MAVLSPLSSLGPIVVPVVSVARVRSHSNLLCPSWSSLAWSSFLLSLLYLVCRCSVEALAGYMMHLLPLSLRSKEKKVNEVGNLCQRQSHHQKEVDCSYPGKPASAGRKRGFGLVG